MFDSREKKLANVGNALNALRIARRDDNYGMMSNAVAWLRNALEDAPTDAEIVREGNEALAAGAAHLAQLRARVEASQQAALQSRLRSCLACGGVELWVNDDVRIEGADIAFTVMVCQTCGDTRFVARDLKAVGMLFTAMRAGGATGPFR